MNKLKAVFLFNFVLFSTGGCVSYILKDFQQGLSSNEECVQTLLDLYNVPAISIAVIDNYKIADLHAFGIKDYQSNEPVTTGTLFQAASLSKPVTAVQALITASQNGLGLDEKLSLGVSDDTVSEDLKSIFDKITLRMLLSHTAGLNIPGFPGYKQSNRLPSLEQIINGVNPANTEQIRLIQNPGELFSYSGGGYVLLQYFLEQFTQIPLNELMASSLFADIGMNNSYFFQPLPDNLKGRAAFGFLSRENKSVEGGWFNYPELAAAGLWTTPEDLAKFMIEIMRGYSGEESFLSKKLVDSFLTEEKDSWGLGIYVISQGDDIEFLHTGLNEGYTCIMSGITSGKGVVVMTNGSKGFQIYNHLLQKIAELYKWPECPVYR
jgi:CubicO group peptidase (beta-lactamase class C family)